MSKQLSVPEPVLKNLVDLISLGTYQNLPYGEITRILESLRKTIQEVPNTQSLEEKIKSLESETEALKAELASCCDISIKNNEAIPAINDARNNPQ